MGKRGRGHDRDFGGMEGKIGNYLVVVVVVVVVVGGSWWWGWSKVGLRRWRSKVGKAWWSEEEGGSDRWG